MGWEEFMQMERKRLSEHREGKLRSALGTPLPDESLEGTGCYDLGPSHH